MNPSTTGGSRDLPPKYLDRLAVVFVLLVTAACFARVFEYVSTWASRIPVQDDLELVQFLVPGAEVTLEQLWHPANEHRIAVPRLVFLALLEWTNDFRSACFFQAWTHLALVLGMLWFVRKLRGHTSFFDAFFPLFWLTLANSENFLLGMQIATDLSVLYVCAALALLCTSRAPPTAARAAGVVGLLLLLPLNGGFGMTQVPAMAVVCAGTAWSLRKQREHRGAMWVFVGGLALLLPLFAAYFHELRSGGMERVPFDAVKWLGIAGQVLTLNYGSAAHEYQWSLALATGGVTLLAVALCVRAAWKQPEERRRALTCLLVLSAPCTTALAIGLGRQSEWPIAGWADRYVTLPSVLFATSFAIFVLYGGPHVGRIAQGFLYSTFLLVLPFNERYGESFAQRRSAPIGEFLLDAKSGTPIPVLARRHHQAVYDNVAGLEQRLALMRLARIPPFETFDPSLIDANDALGQTIAAIHAEDREVRLVQGKPMLIAVCDASIEVDVEPGAGRVRGKYAIPRGVLLASNDSSTAKIAVEFQVLVRNADGAEVQLHTRVLRPSDRKEERGPQEFDVELPAEAARVLLRVVNRDPTNAVRPWGGFGSVEFVAAGQ